MAIALACLILPGMAQAQSAKAAATLPTTAIGWMQHWQRAASQHSYTGTVNLTTERGEQRSAKLWHGVRGSQQIDRIDLQTTPPRTIVRSGSSTVTLFGDEKRARVLHEAPQMAALFPGMDVRQAAQLQHGAQFYQASTGARAQVAGYQADTVSFAPRDNLRHGYRFWSDAKTGVLLKWQMLEMGAGGLADARVLREAGFANVQVPAAVDFADLQSLLAKQPGYAAVQHRLRTVTLPSQGWAWRSALPGYGVSTCYQRGRGTGGMGRGPDGAGGPPAGAGRGWGRGRGAGPMAGQGAGPNPEMRRGMGPVAGSGAAPGEGLPPGMGRGMQRGRFAGGGAVLQCLLTDGLGNISVFIEKPVAPPPPSAPEQQLQQGAVRMVSRWYDNTYRITAVGAVPAAALQGILDRLYRP